MSAALRRTVAEEIVTSGSSNAGRLEHLRAEAYPPGGYVGQQSFMSAGEILTLARAARIGHGGTVLDLCCGRGGPACLIARATGGQILGIDRETSAISAARQAADHLNASIRPLFLVADATRLPLAASFDVVLLLETMLAFADKERLLCEVGRVTRVGGRFGLTIEEGTPLSASECREMPDDDCIWLSRSLATPSPLGSPLRDS